MISTIGNVYIFFLLINLQLDFSKRIRVPAGCVHVQTMCGVQLNRVGRLPDYHQQCTAGWQVGQRDLPFS